MTLNFLENRELMTLYNPERIDLDRLKPLMEFPLTFKYLNNLKLNFKKNNLLSKIVYRFLLNKVNKKNIFQDKGFNQIKTN